MGSRQRGVVLLLCALVCVGHPVAAQTSLAVVGTNVVLGFPTVNNLLYDVQRADNLPAGWSTIASNIPGTGGVLTNLDVGAGAWPRRFYRVRTYTSGVGTGGVDAVVLFSGGSGAGGALVFVGFGSGTLHYVGSSDEFGGLTITNVPVGTFKLRAYSPDNGTLYGETNGTLAVNGSIVNATVILPGTGTADVLVNYANGDPVKAAPVYIIYTGNTGVVTNGPQDTALSGHIIIQSVPIGNFTVKASNPNIPSSSATAVGTIISNGAVANVTINLLTN
jgi:hypothetical protein